MSFTCIICQRPLESTNGRILRCNYCGNKEASDVACSEGHYVCETCRIASPRNLILRVSKASKSCDPFFLANLLMSHPAIASSGPEHHLLVPAVLLTVARNAGFASISNAQIHLAMKRARLFPIGSCAAIGACGAALGVGIAVSVMLKATYAKAEERKAVLTATALTLSAVKELPGRRCCKAAVFASLLTSTQYLHKYLHVALNNPESISCKFSQSIVSCSKQACPFYNYASSNSGKQEESM